MENAGFRITDRHESYIGKDFTEGYVLGVKPNKYVQGGYEYVTWAYTERNGEYNFYWGHYFGSSKGAEEDFLERSGLNHRTVLRG